MTPSRDNRSASSPDVQVPVPENLSAEQLADLTDATKQEEYRKQFLEQMRRRACPGCGDEGPPPF